MSAINLMGVCKRGQIGDEEQIKEQLQVRCLFKVSKLGALLELLVVLGSDRIVPVPRFGVGGL